MMLRHDLQLRRLLKETVPGLIIADGTACNALSLRAHRGKVAVVHACKHPCFVGTVGVHPPTQGVRRGFSGRDMYLDLIDGESVEYINGAAIETALAFLADHAKAGKVVAVHCNQGRSRAPSLALLHLAQMGKLPRDYASALAEFKNLYPRYEPGTGMAAWVRENWERIVDEKGATDGQANEGD